MPIPIKAKLAPKGSSELNSILDNIAGRLSDAAGGAVSDAVGDAIGGAIGGEIGNLAGEMVGELASNMLGGGGGGSSYFAGPAKILARTGGLVFPNTPMIQYGHTANWEDYDLTHSNYGFWGFKNSKPDQISVTGKFSVNTRKEADYVLGSIHFLRAIMKMHYGDQDSSAGTPPPVMEFTALGPEGFNKTPVIVTNFTTNLEDTYDYVMSSSGTFVPILTIISISMHPYFNPSAQQGEFTLDKFKDGSLLNSGWI